MSKPLHILEGVAASLQLSNVDTDSIVPSRFMKTVTREGLGRRLFYNLRYDDSDGERPDFVLNCMPWRNAVFLITQENFGCGSSREHAPWALLDFGIRCVVAPSFADIFATNCRKNGILPLCVDASLCDRLIADALLPGSCLFRLDLEQQTLFTSRGKTISFTISPEHRRQLLLGLDDIDETLRHVDTISSYETSATHPRPFVPLDLVSPVLMSPHVGPFGAEVGTYDPE